MERLQIGEIISELRRQRGITQEQLSKFMGVSTAAVSKWESGASYPDITLLPKIATFFNISIDKLMNFNNDLLEKEVIDIYDECELLFSKGDSLEDAIKKTKNYISKYPNSNLLKFKIAYLFFMYASRAGSEEKCKNMQLYSMQLLEDVANNSSDSKIVEASLFQLGALYSTFEEYEEKAIEALNKIKVSQCDPNDILASIHITQGKFKEGRALYQKKLFKCISEASFACMGLTASYQKEGKDFTTAERYQKLAINMKKLFSPDGDGVLAISNEYYNLASIYLRANKKKEALETLKTMLECLKRNDLNNPKNINSVWCFNEVEDNKKSIKINLYENLFLMFQHPLFDLVREENAVKDIMTLISSKIDAKSERLIKTAECIRNECKKNNS